MRVRETESWLVRMLDGFAQAIKAVEAAKKPTPQQFRDVCIASRYALIACVLAGDCDERVLLTVERLDEARSLFERAAELLVETRFGHNLQARLLDFQSREPLWVVREASHVAAGAAG